MQRTFLTMLLLPVSVLATDWTSDSYDKPACTSSDDISGDIRLLCPERDTIKQLKVTPSQEQLSETYYSAKIKITNKNPYPVEVKSLVVNAYNISDKIIGFCFNDTALKLNTDQSTETLVGCSIHMLDRNQEDIARIAVKASPW